MCVCVGCGAVAGRGSRAGSHGLSCVLGCDSRDLRIPEALSGGSAGSRLLQAVHGPTFLSGAGKVWDPFSASPIWAESTARSKAPFLWNKGAAIPRAPSNLKYQLS